jgi:membrane associated rhomboid family serine protease
LIPVADSIPRRGRPLATRGIILANCLVFLLELALDEDSLRTAFYLFGIVPARYSHPAWAARVGFPVDSYWPFLTSQLLHGGWIHLIGNMWTLWIFGDNVEDRMGHARFLAFYTLCGVAAGIAHFLADVDSTVPALGASGAFSGVLGAYLVLYPRARVVTLVPVFFYPLFFNLPAVLFLAYWFLLQLLSGTLALAAPGAGEGVAWWAHVGGFGFGMLAFWIFLKPRRRRRAPVYR